MRNSFLITGHTAVPLLLWLFSLSACIVQAQLNIQFTPALNGQSVSGLFTAQVQNMSAGAYQGKIQITVRDGSNKVVLLAITPVVTIQPGPYPIQVLASQTKIQFGNSPSAVLTAQTGRFPGSEYEYCFEFNGTGTKPGADEQSFENCYNYTIQPIIPLSLVYPGDGDELCNTRPAFNWQPAMPLVGSYRYRIMVAEENGQQSAVDALMNNVPVLQQENIGFMLPFPAQLPDLRIHSKYAWQVIAYEGGTKITQSEIWAFSINCNDKKLDTAKESYRQLSGSLNGNYYISQGTLHFSLINPYSMQNMQYSITDISDPAREIGNLPPVKVQTGLNKIDITLEDVNGMQVNKMYRLKVRNIGDHALYLQFIYKGDDAQR
jgi:hypothetical protein